MRRLLIMLVAVAPAPHAVRAATDAAAPSSIEQLIAELGNDEYAVRRRAEEQLLRIGPEAFDALTAATDSKDLEIAARVESIIQRLQMEWVRHDDPTDVRRILARFGEESEETRLTRIEELAKLKAGAGGAALCRIARFDASPIVSRHAAAAVLNLELTAEERREVARAWRAELGKSDRPPVHWIGLYLRELDDANHALPEWAAANAAELAVYKDEKGSTDYFTVRELLDRHLTRCEELDAGPAMTAALMMIVEMTHDANEPIGLDVGLGWALRWIISHQAWPVVASLEDKYEIHFRNNRALLYYLATAARRGGREDRAGEIAERAFQLAHPSNVDAARRAIASEYAAINSRRWSEETSEIGVAEDLARTAIASDIAARGQLDWAEREYRRIIDKSAVISKAGMSARSDLATWLHDREEYQAAADMLGEFCDAIDADAEAKIRLIAEIDDDPYFNGSGKETIAGVEARRYFYLACVDEQRKDYDAQRTHLTQGAQKYPEDPDILIALYRLPADNDDQRQAVTGKIRHVAATFQQQIVDYPTIPNVYNQWAWLIANTEGDQQKAVEYSLKSLELAPDEPSYLDTLGRCYFAVGDLENAVKSQRKAVELAPHYRVMQRQLALFEAALAKQSGD